MEEWNQWRADNRSLETMRQIALDAMALEEDDDDAFYDYAEEHDLTVNEVACYLNAYEYGGEAGLEAIRNPDIVPPDVARGAIKAIAKVLDQHFEDQVPYRPTDEGTGIGLYEIQERQNGDRYLFPVCQLRLTLATRQWHLYWMRKFDAWWPYPLPERGRKHTLNARIQQVWYVSTTLRQLRLESRVWNAQFVDLFPDSLDSSQMLALARGDECEIAYLGLRPWLYAADR